MGIDVYLDWPGSKLDDSPDWNTREACDNWSKMRFAPGVYLRESYFSKAYATHVFVPETFETYPFTNIPMSRKDDWPQGVYTLNTGVHYPWHVLANRMEAVTKKSYERYEDSDIAKEHIDQFAAFVFKVKELEQDDIMSWVVNSY